MTSNATSFPFFIPTDARSLSIEEVAIVQRLLSGQAEKYKSQEHGLVVVGRCGCGVCPTIFFQPHAEGDHERDLISHIGKDSSGGLDSVVLMEKDGLLSQLEFYSVDGHDPWSVPHAESLESYL